jgi:hypothetical protein
LPIIPRVDAIKYLKAIYEDSASNFGTEFESRREQALVEIKLMEGRMDETVDFPELTMMYAQTILDKSLESD